MSIRSVTNSRFLLIVSDRLLELTGTIAPGGNKQILDKLDVERERGITVKAQTCTMLYNYKVVANDLNLLNGWYS